MRLFKNDNIDDYIIPKDLSIGATGMLNSLLVRTNDELENTDLYALNNDSRKDVYTFEEFQKYITGTTSLNDKTMFEMLYYCGLRRCEARGLQWSDIDWNNKLVSITKQANSVKDSQKYYELTPPKTSKSIRTLPLTEVLYNDLVNLYNKKKKYYGFNDKWFIFGEHEALTFGMMSRINGRIAKNADI